MEVSAQLGSYADSRAMEKSIPLGRMGNAGDMAGVAIFLAARSGAWVTGVVIPVDGGQLAAPIQDESYLRQKSDVLPTSRL